MKLGWDSFTTRLRNAARKKLRGNSDGLCVITVHILCDAEGDALVWTEPNVLRIEPSKDAKAQMLKIMSG